MHKYGRTSTMKLFSLMETVGTIVTQRGCSRTQAVYRGRMTHYCRAVREQDCYPSKVPSRQPRLRP